jgi:UDP-glucose 4-epimerase
MKILITGGAGFIGSHIVEYFHKKAEVCVLDNLRSGLKKSRGIRLQLHRGFDFRLRRCSSRDG